VMTQRPEFRLDTPASATVPVAGAALPSYLSVGLGGSVRELGWFLYCNSGLRGQALDRDEVCVPHSSCRATKCTPRTMMMKAFVRNTFHRLLVQFATTVDRVIEQHELGFFYQPQCSRGWVHFEVFRDESSWTAWLGKFELVWDRPRFNGASR